MEAVEQARICTVSGIGGVAATNPEKGYSQDNCIIVEPMSGWGIFNGYQVDGAIGN